MITNLQRCVAPATLNSITANVAARTILIFHFRVALKVARIVLTRQQEIQYRFRTHLFSANRH